MSKDKACLVGALQDDLGPASDPGHAAKEAVRVYELELVQPLGQLEHAGVHGVELRRFGNDVQLVDALEKDWDADGKQAH